MIYLTYFAQEIMKLLGSPIRYMPGYGIDAFTLIGFLLGCLFPAFIYTMIYGGMWIGQKLSVCYEPSRAEEILIGIAIVELFIIAAMI